MDLVYYHYLNFIFQEYIFGVIKNGMKDNEKIIKCMDKVNFFGQMDGYIKDNLMKIKSMEKEY